MNYQFKILEGNHTGASIDLDENQRYLAANDYNHDIYLPIESENKISFAFTIHNDKIIISEVVNDIYCNNGKLLINEEYALPLFLESHKLKFVIHDNKEQINNWVAVTNKEAVINELIDTETILQHMLPDNAVSKPKNKIISKIKDYIKQKQKIVLLFILSFFILIVLIIGLIKYSNFTTKLQLEQTTTSNLNQSIKKQFISLPSKYFGLKLLNNNNKYTLSGIVDNAEDLNFLKNHFAKYLSQIEFSVLQSDNAIEKVSQILINHQLKTIKVNFDSINQQICLSGIINGLSEINDIELDISNQLPELNNLNTSKIFQKYDIEKDLDKIIDNKLSPRLTINKDWNLNIISISGFLTNEESKQIGDSLKELTTKYQDVFKINLNIKDALNIIPFNISQVYTGNPQFLVTSSGEKVFVGGEIAGFKIASIDQNKIVFSGKFPVIIPLDKITTNNNSSKNNMPSDLNQKEIIKNEQQQELDYLNKEKKYLEELTKLKAHTTDIQLIKFIDEHINNLKQDIAGKEKELEYYNKTESNDNF